MCSAPGFQLRIVPSSVMLMIASTVEATIAATWTADHAGRRSVRRSIEVTRGGYRTRPAAHRTVTLALRADPRRAPPAPPSRLPAHARPRAANARRGRGVPRRPRRVHLNAGLDAAEPLRRVSRGAVQERLARIRLVAKDEVRLGVPTRGAAGRARAEGASGKGLALSSRGDAGHRPARPRRARGGRGGGR